MKRALMLALTAFAVAAPAAHARTDDFAKPVLMVPGPEKPSCSQFDDMKKIFRAFSTTVKGQTVKLEGKLIVLGLTAGQAGCDRSIAAPSGASIETLGDELAAWITKNHGSESVDVVGYGQGGLIVRAALSRHPELKIEDAVTLGTPHAGSTLHRNPQGDGGTDWSVIGSRTDTEVPAESAVDMDAAHKTLYVRDQSHAQLLIDGYKVRNAWIDYAHDGGEFKRSTGAPRPVLRVAEDLVFGSDAATGRTCGYAATNPEECGVTPIILLPGFGASELVCGPADNPTDLWPGAITPSNGDRFVTMALNERGDGPETHNACTDSIRPTGNALGHIFGFKNIHFLSAGWIQEMGGKHGYVFGWDFRLGPDKTIARLDKYIDEVLARHAATKVAIVSHSYGGLLTRWYVDDADRAKKIARVANFGSPYWGAPKAWFAVAYGYETPLHEISDDIVANDNFRHWTRNLTGMYYLIPPQAWFDHVPGRASTWLEVNDWAMPDAKGAARAFGEAGGNQKLALEVAAKHAKHIDGFKTHNGAIDWRIFVGSGKPTMGHVRAFTSTGVDPQYSWVNGDGTVPLISQRQAYKTGSKQMGDQVKTYNFCGVGHMGEMEDRAIQNAVAPFVTTGADPIKDQQTLRDQPCDLDASEFKLEGEEDETSVKISEAFEAGAKASRVRARAAAATEMTLVEAEQAGLVDVIRGPRTLQFVTTTSKPLSVSLAGAGAVTVTPITGDGQEGKARVYDLGATPIAIDADGAKTASAAPSRPADTRAPKTTATIKRGKLRVKTKDASGVQVTLVQVGKARPKVYKRALRVGARAKVRVWSVDTAGNTERKRLVRR
ncbi:hypothetical protein DVA67_026850 [Solirubrobacter sp. CPCC 204708]|uniref:Lecithin:cholesterol acyltransferase n=1 Tax=Solirubrobacter deserti TaxID=2282478 RepID=A0ABT4RGK7_9ACTN|nr:hypothetical protein [Solirubrobacter deserti]MBE2319616.1 hypothetical protein [Solirubrobacter deserti]MDA0137645.1 hypothetical protein [Solirubrobacter deserti]